MNPNQHLPRVVEIGEADFKSEVLNSEQPVLVEFSAAWSRPCHILDSVLEAVAAACAEKVRVFRINADDHPDLSLWYEVQSIPTLLYFVTGKLRAKIVGTASKEAILAKLKSVTPDGDEGSLNTV